MPAKFLCGSFVFKHDNQTPTINRISDAFVLGDDAKSFRLGSKLFVRFISNSGALGAFVESNMADEIFKDPSSLEISQKFLLLKNAVIYLDKGNEPTIRAPNVNLNEMLLDPEGLFDSKLAYSDLLRK